MTDETKNTQSEEVKPEAQEVKKSEEQTLGDVLGTQTEPKTELKNQTRTVPESKFLELKKEMKELKREAKGRSNVEISESIDDFSKKFNLPSEFTSELTALISQENKKSVEDVINSKVKPLEEKEKAKQIDKNFNEAYKKVLEEMPEYKNIASKEVIKAMALNPNNSKKKFSEILEISYGHLIRGKATMENTVNRADKFMGEIDMTKAKKDTEYFKQIMADPVSRKKYNENIEKRLNL